MTIEELNKLIKEELKAYLNEEQTDEAYHEDGDDDIEVTTDEPDVEDGDEALDTLKQIFNMLKPIVEPEEDEPEMDMDSEMDDDEEADEDMREGKDDEKDEDMKEGKDDEKDEDEKNEAVGYPNYKASDVQKVKVDVDDVNRGLNESVDLSSRFKKLANIK